MLIDLTYPLSECTPVYPGDPLFQRSVESEHETDGYRLCRLTFGTHFGTHIDAPLHYFIDGEPLDAFPLETFFSDAIVCDLREDCAPLSPNAPPVQILPEHLAPFTPILEHYQTVILRTGWGEHWGKPDYFTSFPSLLPETADWLADFPIQLLGLDTPSLSAYGNALFFGTAEESSAPDSWGGELTEALLHSDSESHRILLGRRPPILLLENLAHLDQLPAITSQQIQCGEDGMTSSVHPAQFAFRLTCFPLPVAGVDGLPVRAVAQLSQS